MKKDLILKPVGRDQMVYDPERDAVHILNPTAQVVLELHGQGLDEAAIAAELGRRFRLAPGQDPLADVRACLDSLRKGGVLEG